MILPYTVELYARADERELVARHLANVIGFRHGHDAEMYLRDALKLLQHVPANGGAVAWRDLAGNVRRNRIMVDGGGVAPM